MYRVKNVSYICSSSSSSSSSSKSSSEAEVVIGACRVERCRDRKKIISDARMLTLFHFVFELFGRPGRRKLDLFLLLSMSPLLLWSSLLLLLLAFV